MAVACFVVGAELAVVSFAQVLDVDFGAADGIADGLGALGRVLADGNFFDDAGALGDDGLFGGFDDFDCLVTKFAGFRGGDGTVDGVAIDAYVVLAEGDLLFDRTLDDMTEDAHTAAIDDAFADL